MLKVLFRALATCLPILIAGCQSNGNGTNTAATQPTTVPSIHHILLEVSDLNRSLPFYRDALGLRLISRKGDFATLESANVGVYLWQSRWAWEAPRNPDERNGLGIYPHFAVPDVDATAARLEQAGYKIVQQPRLYGWGTEAFVADPDGFIWALVNMPQQPAREDHR